MASEARHKSRHTSKRKSRIIADTDEPDPIVEEESDPIVEEKQKPPASKKHRQSEEHGDEKKTVIPYARRYSELAVVKRAEEFGPQLVERLGGIDLNPLETAFQFTHHFYKDHRLTQNTEKAREAILHNREYFANCDITQYYGVFRGVKDEKGNIAPECKLGKFNSVDMRKLKMKQRTEADLIASKKYHFPPTEQGPLAIIGPFSRVFPHGSNTQDDINPYQYTPSLEHALAFIDVTDEPLPGCHSNIQNGRNGDVLDEIAHEQALGQQEMRRFALKTLDGTSPELAAFTRDLQFSVCYKAERKVADLLNPENVELREQYIQAVFEKYFESSQRESPSGVSSARVRSSVFFEEPKLDKPDAKPWWQARFYTREMKMLYEGSKRYVYREIPFYDMVQDNKRLTYYQGCQVLYSDQLVLQRRFGLPTTEERKEKDLSPLELKLKQRIPIMALRYRLVMPFHEGKFRIQRTLMGVYLWCFISRDALKQQSSVSVPRLSDLMDEEEDEEEEEEAREDVLMLTSGKDETTEDIQVEDHPRHVSPSMFPDSDGAYLEELDQ